MYTKRDAPTSKLTSLLRAADTYRDDHRQVSMSFPACVQLAVFICIQRHSSQWFSNCKVPV
jgi:hypothetical protein